MANLRQGLKKPGLSCQWSNPPAVSKTIEISPANLQAANQSKTALRIDIELRYPGIGNDEKPEISYKTNKKPQENPRKINYGTEIINDDNLMIPAAGSRYGICSLSKNDQPATISYLKKLWGGHLTLNGRIINESAEQKDLKDYILFEWYAVRKGRAPNQGEKGVEISKNKNMAGITPYIKAVIDIKPKDMNPPGYPLIIEADYSQKDGFYYSFGPINRQKITPDTEAPLGAVEATDNAYGLKEGAFIKLHKTGEYQGLITFTGTIVNIKPDDHLKYALTDVVIHQWELAEIL
ncbi:MAG: hypothetical protein K6U80_16780 [Firmicutes bacterium]|nr:hypothetical protein [Bacillota bacterium]